MTFVRSKCDQIRSKSLNPRSDLVLLPIVDVECRSVAVVNHRDMTALPGTQECPHLRYPGSLGSHLRDQFGMTKMTVGQSPAWETASVRVTAFQKAPIDLHGLSWWKFMTGSDPESTNIRVGAGQLQESGTVEGTNVALSVLPNRIDWTISPKDDAEKGGFGSLGDFAAASHSVSAMIAKWLPQAPALNRLAFGAQLVVPANDQVAAMRIVSGMLDFIKIDWTGLRDFTFQANRPKSTAILPDMEPFNRVVKFQAIVRKRVLATFGTEPPPPIATTSEQNAAYCELDFSTAVPTNPQAELPRENLEKLLNALVESAKDAVLKGDWL
jgi:hypothetical protein